MTISVATRQSTLYHLLSHIGTLKIEADHSGVFVEFAHDDLRLYAVHDTVIECMEIIANDIRQESPGLWLQAIKLELKAARKRVVT